MPAHRRRGRPPHPDILTPAEWEVLDWLRHGVSRREVARRRRTGIDAVKYHIANITAKLGVDGSARLRLWPGYPASTSYRERSSPMQPTTQTTLRLGRLGQVSLFVRNIARAEAFYRDTLGLPHLFTFGDLAFFDAGGTRIYLHRKDEEEWRRGSVLYFVVEDIDAAHHELAGRGVAFSGAPHLIHTHDDGTQEWMAFFDDGEGNTLALMSRVSPSSADQSPASSS